MPIKVEIIDGRVVTTVLEPTEDDVRAEAQRRIIALTGAKDLMDCFAKQLNANIRANELNDIRRQRELTEVESAQAGALRALAETIQRIRAASNAFTSPIPADYEDDRYWLGPAI